MFFGLFTKKKRGCLHGKTKEQKESFFKSLCDFATSDGQFFKEQFEDLLPHEQKEFIEWVENNNEQLRMIKSLLDVLGQLLKEKHEGK